MRILAAVEGGGCNEIENVGEKAAAAVGGVGDWGGVNQIFYDNVLKIAVSKEEQIIRQN